MVAIDFQDVRCGLQPFIRADLLPLTIKIHCDDSASKPRLCKEKTSGHVVLRVNPDTFGTLQVALKKNQGNIYALLCSILKSVDVNFNEMSGSNPPARKGGIEINVVIHKCWTGHFSETVI